MSTAVTQEVWAAALGPSPENGPVPSVLGGVYGYEFDNPDHWPAKGEGLSGAVFWLRWWHDRLSFEGMTVRAAVALRTATLHELQTGGRQVLAVHPDKGRAHPIPARFWQARSEAARACSWSGQWWSDDDIESPYELYVIEPESRPGWWPGEKQSLKSWCAPRGPADGIARDRLKAQGQASPSEKAICGELFVMWREAGRESSSSGSIETARSRMR